MENLVLAIKNLKAEVLNLVGMIAFAFILIPAYGLQLAVDLVMEGLALAYSPLARFVGAVEGKKERFFNPEAVGPTKEKVPIWNKVSLVGYYETVKESVGGFYKAVSQKVIKAYYAVKAPVLTGCKTVGAFITKILNQCSEGLESSVNALVKLFNKRKKSKIICLGKLNAAESSESEVFNELGSSNTPETSEDVLGNTQGTSEEKPGADP